ncbi:MAG: hypothetical protein HZY78_06845 [Burkholderiaceae bacterium]|nr:MAG: hypothetical protein HZY78_06845 [Burkholderiaceae bacterium]
MPHASIAAAPSAWTLRKLPVAALALAATLAALALLAASLLGGWELLRTALTEPGARAFHGRRSAARSGSATCSSGRCSTRC